MSKHLTPQYLLVDILEDYSPALGRMCTFVRQKIDTMQKIHTLFFSPTKTTKTLTNKIAEAINGQVLTHDLTHETPNQDIEIPQSDITIVGMPVYAGRMPEVAAERLAHFTSAGGNVVLVAVYGNRHYDDALQELQQWSIKAGFKTIAAGAFIGEHSFASNDYPIAQHRPDEQDLQKAFAFGQAINKKIQTGNMSEINTKDLPGNTTLKAPAGTPPETPVTNMENCTLCGKCADVCPTSAITLNGQVQTQNDNCIICMACVKICPQQAREANSPFFNGIREKLYTACADRKEPVVFL